MKRRRSAAAAARVAGAVGVGALGVGARVASACPFCAANAGSLTASYYFSTALLSLLPLILLGSILIWLRRSARRASPPPEDRPRS